MTWQAGQTITVQTLLDNTPHTITNGYAANVATSPASGVTAETIYLTTGTMTFRNGRAYRITLSTLLMGTQPDTGRIFLKRANIIGSVLFDTQAIAVPRSGSTGRVTFTNNASNSTGSDITDICVATIQRLSGTAGTFTLPASTTSPSYVHIEDIGPATDYPNASPIT
jgi:hypothetical protein